MTGLLMWFHLFAFFLVISSVFKKPKDWLIVFSISISVAIIISLISLMVLAGSNIMGLKDSSRGGATIGNSSFMGTYLLFNVFLALWIFFNFGIGVKIFSGLAIFIMALATYLNDARAAGFSILGGLFLILCFFLIFQCKRKYLRVTGLILLGTAVLVFLISSFFLFQPGSFVQQKFVQLATQARLVVWQAAWKGFQERPWLGWGPENFDFVFTKYFNPCMFLPECGGEIWFDRAHNIIFDTLVTTGIIGFLGYLGIFFSIFYVLWRKYFKQYINFWTVGIFSVTLISYFVQNLTVFDMINSYLMFILVLGLIGSIASEEGQPRGLDESLNELREGGSPQKKTLFFKSFYLVTILILFLFSFSKFVIKPFQTDFYVIEAIRQKPASEERLSFYKKTLETSPLGKYQIRDFFAQSTLESIESLKKEKVPLEKIRPELDFVSNELEKSIKEAPLEYRNFLKLGEIYNTYAFIDSAKLSRAEEILKKAIEMSPTNQQGYWVLAQTKIFQGNFSEALSLAEKALELEPKMERSHLIVIQIAKIMGDLDLAKKKAKEAIEINPAWEDDLKKILES
jgi:O-antigen ligase